MGRDCQMPIADRAPTKPDGTPFTIDDREYWELAGANGGIRRYAFHEYPRMVYRAERGSDGRVDVTSTAVEHARAWEALGPAWKASADEAKAYFDGLEQDIARAAAEAAHSAQSMSSKARKEYEQRSASSPKHITE